MRVLDLFCGAAGGWSLGLHRAGFQTVAACEIDPARRAAFAKNNPGVVMYDDVRTLTAARLLRDLGYLPELVAGSPPCQDASTANHKGKGIDGERTGLFREFVRLVGEIRPHWVAAENVPGLRTRGADWVLDALEAIGYPCWPLVVGAVHAGAPHLRKRVWFIAADTNKVGVRKQPRWCGRSDREEEAEPADDSDAQRDHEHGFAVDGEVGGPLGSDAFDADEARLAQRQSERSDVITQLASVERAVGSAGVRWLGGPAGHLGVAHGVSTWLAAVRVPLHGEEGTRNGIAASTAAYGDAVVPQITEAIGHAIRRTEQALRAMA